MIRSGGKLSQRRMEAPKAAPMVWPRITSTMAVMITAGSRHASSGTHALTRGMAKKAATAPATKPAMPPRVTTKPFRRPVTRYTSSTITRTMSKTVKSGT